MNSYRTEFPIDRAEGGVVVFDLDKTLTDRDTVSRFLFRWLSSNQHFGRSIIVATEVLKFGIHNDRRKLRSRVSEHAFCGQPRTFLENAGQSFAKTIRDNYLRQNVVKFARTLKEAGAEILIVTSAYETYAKPLAMDLGFDGCLGTQIDFDESQQALGLRGTNCWGPEKVRRYNEWADVNSKPSPILVVGDSRGDRELWELGQFNLRVTRNGEMVKL